MPKATNTHSEYVILIAFALQQWLHERTLKLRYTYIDCFVFPMFHCCRSDWTNVKKNTLKYCHAAYYVNALRYSKHLALRTITLAN